MILTEKEQRIEGVLEKYARSLDITDEQKQEAIEKYEKIGEWLQTDNFFKDYNPDIYPHGSFALNTMVKPLQKEEFDLDIMCNITKGTVLKDSQELKECVEDRILKVNKENPCLDAEIDTSYPRCITLDFPSKFNMDIVPSKYKDFSEVQRIKRIYPDIEEYLEYGVYIPDKSRNWCDSNPKGYTKWFLDLSEHSSKYEQLLNEKKASREDIKPYEVKTPLQMATQILKRHASNVFNGDSLKEYKPASIIITTLLALSYEKEGSIYYTLLNFKKNVLSILGKDFNGRLQNPVNPNEYFTDLWVDKPKSKQYFFLG